ncbi:carbohydrate ABC transporter permease [Butyrivibrio sp. MC2013]|uniref:carbohydrate ABC transporter permease n=1 Tax=Butyrivibrio sp. MC2013 TaxID=1280686 RepID=UPI0004227B65|nr:carbohydrate ABC transporter permease [Butyrivibrio sp. MC2013]
MTKYIKKTMVAALMLFIILIALTPFIWVFMASFKTNAEILSGTIGLPKVLHVQNYVTAFKLAPLVTFYKNSIIVGIVATLLNLIVCSMAAYVVVRCDFKAKGLVTLIFSIGLIVPAAALLQPLYTTLQASHLYNTLTGLILVYTAIGMPTTFYVMVSYIRTIPFTLEEAAYIDGCGFARTFFTIVLPITRPAFATAGVIQFLLAWNEFQFALTLTGETSKRTLPIALYYFKSAFASDYGAMFAATVVVITPSILIFILLQKQIISGLAAGSVKG